MRLRKRARKREGKREREIEREREGEREILFVCVCEFDKFVMKIELKD